MRRMFVLLLLSTPSLVLANGQTTHLWITDTAITHVQSEPLFALLSAHPDPLRAGTMFPDGGYAIGHEYGEIAHWEPFQDRFRDWITDTFDDPSSPEAAPHVAFYLGLQAGPQPQLVPGSGGAVPGPFLALLFPAAPGRPGGGLNPADATR